MIDNTYFEKRLSVLVAGLLFTGNFREVFSCAFCTKITRRQAGGARGQRLRCFCRLANGDIDTEFIPVESDHSSMSAAVGVIVCDGLQQAAY